MTISDVHVLGLLSVTHFVASAGYGAIFILCLLQSCCVPTSSELTMGLAGALAAQGKLSIVAVIVVGVVGEVVGAFLAWMIGRYAGRAAVDRFGRYVLVSHRDLDRAEDWYERHGRFGVFGSRLLPVIRNFVALPAGIAEVPLLRFGLLTAGGSLVWDGAWAGIGYGVGDHWQAIAKAVGDLGYVLAVLAVGLIAFAVFHRYRRYKDGTSGDGDPHHSRGGGGRVRWVGGTSSEPGPDRWPSGPSPERRPQAASLPGTDRWVASSSGQPDPRTARHRDFPNSPLHAWERAVTHGRQGATGPRPGLGCEPDLLDHDDRGVESNSRLTAMLGVLLLVLLAIEGATILRVGPLLTLHVVVGMILVPVVVLKIGATTWRFARYYLGSPEYRRRGPPPAVLRLLGPVVVVTSLAVLGTGIALLLAPASLRSELLLAHKVTFVLWFAAMVVHVLGHLLDAARVAPRDFLRRTRRQVRGASTRQWAIVSAVCVGILLAMVIAPKIGPWLTERSGGPPVAHVPATSAGHTLTSARP